MNSLTSTILTIASLISALGIIFGVFCYVYRWYTKNEKQDAQIKELKEEIKEIKEEQRIATKGMLACLKGLQERGCNGPVTEAIKEFEDHLNLQAHK